MLGISFLILGTNGYNGCSYQFYCPEMFSGLDLKWRSNSLRFLNLIILIEIYSIQGWIAATTYGATRKLGKKKIKTLVEKNSKIKGVYKL